MGWFSTLLGDSQLSEFDENHSSALSKIEQTLSTLPENEASYLACLGLLAARVANADSHVSEGEKTKILEAFTTKMGLSDALAEAVTNLALEHELSLSVEFHLVTAKINETATSDQKHDLIRLLFAIAAEKDISEAESDTIGMIASALLLPRSEFIALRSEYSEFRSILKNLPGKLK